MTLEQIKLLVKNGVELEFSVESAILALGYWVNVRKAHDLTAEFEPLATARKSKEHRLFKSLDAVFGLIVIDLEHDFTVKGSTL